MTAIMACKLNGLFDVGEDFDDEDLPDVDWSAPPVSGPAAAAVSSNYVSSNVLRGPAAIYNNLATKLPTEGLPSASHRTAQNVLEQNTVGQTAVLGLRQLSTSVPRQSSSPPVLRQSSSPPRGRSGVIQQTSSPPRRQVESKREAPLPPDDFDDWDIDLADLEACDPQAGAGIQVGQTVTPPAPPASASVGGGAVSPAKRLRPSGCGHAQTVSGAGGPPGGFDPSRHSGPPGTNLSLRPRIPAPFLSPPGPPRPSFLSAPPQSPGGVFPGLVAPSPSPRPFSRPATPRPDPPPQLQRPWSTPGPHAGRCMFDAVSPAASPSPRPSPLHTPVLTNHLVQLVSACNRTPGTPRCSSSDPTRPRTRRFPGPAGILPRQPLGVGQSLDDIVVAIPQTPAHGAVARPPSQVPSSQSEEEDFSGGPWAAMKAEMGLDERNPSCFLHSYSVVMVLRKAAMKQLLKNKVPNMAVVLKSILHTHADAKAVFRDHTGEMQGTVHRRLLEDRLGELKTGAVLLLKQVGVFSPSHRNHYLNVTPNNLLRIYPPRGAVLTASQPLPPPHLEPLTMSPRESSGAHVSRMELTFDDDDDDEEEEEGQAPDVPAVSKTVARMLPQRLAGAPPPHDQTWDADDDLDELLGDLPVEY